MGLFGSAPQFSTRRQPERPTREALLQQPGSPVPTFDQGCNTALTAALVPVVSEFVGALGVLWLMLLLGRWMMKPKKAPRQLWWHSSKRRCVRRSPAMWYIHQLQRVGVVSDLTCLGAVLAWPTTRKYRRKTFSCANVFMDNENILIWNARGLNGRARRAALADLVAQERVSLVCVQETKLSSRLMSLL
jgi:hypothetical protein